MESGSPLHKSKTGASGMVPYRGVTDLSRLPLLPFERELVATLGCTEAEYRAFTVEAMKRSRVRPAEIRPECRIYNTAVALYLA
jgi:hypothetical protein